MAEATPPQVIVNEFLGKDPREFEKTSRHAAVLFADLVASTEYKRHHEPMRGIAKSVRHNEIVRECVGHHHGEISKYLGDGAMAFFTAAAAEKNAIDCGIAILRAMEKANEDFEFPHRLETRVGIHSGPVWFFKFESTNAEDPMGTTVDIAARLCAASPQQHVVITEDVYKAAGEVSNASQVYQRLLKGCGKPIEVRTISHDNAPLPLPLAGHNRETPEQLKEVLESALKAFYSKDYENARQMFQSIVADDPGNFEANYRAAEILLLEGNGSEKSTLDQAMDHLCNAKQIRPESAAVWYLLSWTRFRYYEIDRTDTNMLTKAISHCEAAIERAKQYMDVSCQLQSQALLANHLLALVDREDSNENVTDLLDRAKELCTGVDANYENVLQRDRSAHLITHVRVMIRTGSTEFDRMLEMLKTAEALNPLTPKVHTARAEVVQAQYGNGGTTPRP